MPIKIQKGLPAKTVLESENIFVMAGNFDIKLNAPEGRYGNPAPSGIVQHAFTGGLHIFNGKIPRVKEHIPQPLK